MFYSAKPAESKYIYSVQLISNKPKVLVTSNTFGFSAIAGSLIIVSIRGLDQNDRINPSYLPICVSARSGDTVAAGGGGKDD